MGDLRTDFPWGLERHRSLHSPRHPDQCGPWILSRLGTDLPTPHPCLARHDVHRFFPRNASLDPGHFCILVWRRSNSTGDQGSVLGRHPPPNRLRDGGRPRDRVPLRCVPSRDLPRWIPIGSEGSAGGRPGARHAFVAGDAVCGLASDVSPEPTTTRK